MKNRILLPHQIEPRLLSHHRTGETYTWSRLLSEHFGSRQLFISHETLPPGANSSSPHRHTEIEEILLLIRGRLILHQGEQNEELREGSFVFFSPQEESLHYVSNPSGENAEFLLISISRGQDRVLTETHPGWTPPVLETSRMRLRPIVRSDAPAIFRYASNPNVSRLTLWEPHETVKASLSYIEDYCLPYYARGVPEPLGIELKEQPGMIIGTVGCFWVSEKSKSMELAYAISEDHWGQGLVAEAALEVMDYCFREFHLTRIQARCKTENRASARVMEKIGMQYEGTLRSSLFHRSRYWDIAVYGILRI